MQWLAKIAIRRAVFATVLMLAVVVVGIAGYGHLGVDFFPKLDVPVVAVVTRLPGAAPEEVESQISEKIEAAVNTISGLDELRSSSSEGVSTVLILFEMEKNPDVATQEVRDHVQRVLFELPRGIDPPMVTKLDPDAVPVLFVAVRGKASVREMTEIADKRIRRAIENTPGVGQVMLLGGRKRQINVLVDAAALRAHSLTALDVQRAIAAQNLSTPGGTVQTGPRDLTLRVLGRVETVVELGRVVVRQVGDHPVRVQDVAKVEDGEREAETAASVDGEATVLLAIQKQSGQNTVAVVDNVRERLGRIEKSLPAGFTLEVVRDQSGGIRTQVRAVEEHLVLGALLAALVVLLFLGSLRSTIIAATSIPISIIGTFALMWIQGFTLNIATLLALALSVGIVIDDAIVVLENIFRFVHEKGMKPFPAAIAATRDIGLAVLATTLSLMAVFLPIGFMSGTAGMLLKSFGLTMAFAIGVSLLVAFTLTPMLAARWLVPAAEARRKSVLERLVDRGYRPVEGAYMTTLRFAMRHRWLVVVLSLVALGSIIPLAKSVSKSFTPVNDDANFMVNILAPEGTSLEATRLAGERVAREVRRIPGVAHTVLTIGDTDQRLANLVHVYVALTDPRNRAQTQEQIVERTRLEVVAKQPKGLRIDVSEVDQLGTGTSRKTVQYVLTGPDFAQLGRFSSDIVRKLTQVPGATDVDSDLAIGKPEVQVRVLRDRAADLGVQVADVASAVQLLVGGLKASTFAEGGEEYDVWLRAGLANRSQAERLGMLTVPSARLGSVPLGNLVRLSSATGPSQVNRINRQRQVTISANVAPGFSESDVQAQLEKAAQDEQMPPEYRTLAVGRTKAGQRAIQAFLIAFALAFIFMYLVLAAQFESWLHPFTIMLCLPLTVPFALLSLVLLGQSFNMMSALGLFVLFGVVKKNGILQVDHTNSLRAQGMPRDEAILLANQHRLRPILMTTVAFVAGMLPLATARGIGAGFNHATAGIVVGGQTLSLLLTLLAIPVFYSLFDDAAAWLRRHLGARGPVDRGRSEIGLAEESLAGAGRRADGVAPLREPRGVQP
jgi:hydrophobic/amphiphilic exporter-1 (mainly G- bacteria), HAE1 family